MGILMIAFYVFIFTFLLGAGVLTFALLVIKPMIWMARKLRSIAR